MKFQSSLLLLVLLMASSLGETWIAPSAAFHPGEMRLSNEPSLVTRDSNNICTENGIFPVHDSCSDYYLCSDRDRRGMQIYHFTCPQGTTFDHFSNTCHSPTMSTTRPGCENTNNDVSYAIRDSNSVPLIRRRKRRFLPSQENWNQKGTDNCILIHHVDKYASLVRSMEPVILPEYVDVEDFTAVVDEYNEDLEIAQRNSYVWPNGDITSGIKRTYELARFFAPVFLRKFRIMQEKIDNWQISPDDLREALELESQIEILKSENVNMTAIITTSGFPEIFKSYFQERVRHNIAKIERKEQELSDMNMPVLETIEEVVDFMEFVRHDASQIRDEAKSTLTMIVGFRDHLARDESSFNRSKEILKHSILNLEREKSHSLANMDHNQHTENNRQLIYEIRLLWSAVIESQKLHLLTTVEDYLRAVIDDDEMILTSITRALFSLNKIVHIFHHIIRYLEDLISIAEVAKSHSERQDIKHFIYGGHSSMESTWNSLHAHITSLGTCAHDAFLFIPMQLTHQN